MVHELGVSVRVNSGYRCPKHNADIGGSKVYQHMNVQRLSA